MIAREQGRSRASAGAAYATAALRLLLCLLCALPGAAIAAAAPARPRAVLVKSQHRARVDALVATAHEATARRDFDAAYRALAEAFKLSPSTELLYHLGQLAVVEDRLVAAHDLLRRFLQESGAEAATPAQKDAERVLAQERPPSAEASVQGPRGALLFVDDRIVGVLPLSLPLLLPPGQHSLELVRGSRRVHGQLRVPAERSAQVRFTLAPDAMVVTQVPALLLLSQLVAVPAEQQQRLTDGAAQAVTRAHFSVLERERALQLAPHLAGCLDTAACQEKLASMNALRFVLSVRAERSGDDVVLAARLFDAEVGDDAAQAEQRCTGCSAEQASAQLGALTSRLLAEALARPRGLIEVTSQPAGSIVRIDGRVVGKTPLTRPAWSGEHSVEVTSNGYLTYQNTVMVAGGRGAALDVTLQRGDAAAAPPEVQTPQEVPEPPPAGAGAGVAVDGAQTPPPTTVLVRQPRPRWRIGVGIASLAAGALLGGFAIGAFVVNNQCAVFIEGTPVCRKVFDSNSFGAELMVPALAALTVGIVLVALPGKRQRMLITPAATRSGASLGISGEF